MNTSSPAVRPIRSLAGLLVLALALLAVPSVFAGTTILNVTLTSASPIEHWCGNAPNWYYQEFTLTAYESGSHTFTIQNNTVPNGGWMLLYLAGTFNPANDCLNLLAENGSTLSYTFTEGQQYTLIATTNTAAQTGTFEIVYDFLGAPPAVEVPHIPNPDPDGDGIPSDQDNCPHGYNPDQEDGWGSGMGDVCDTDWYNMRGIGISGFEQKNGVYHLHGNCIFLADGDPRCPEIGIFDPAAFTPGAMPMEVTTEFAGTWSVWIHYLHSNNGADVYQVNIYSTNPPQPDTLLDDHLEIHVYSGGSWEWYHRGGAKNSSGGASNHSGGTGASRG